MRIASWLSVPTWLVRGPRTAYRDESNGTHEHRASTYPLGGTTRVTGCDATNAIGCE